MKEGRSNDQKMQNGGQKKATSSRKESKPVSKLNVPNTHANANSAIEKAQLLASLQQDLMAELSGSEEGEVSEVESFILDQEELENGPTIEIANKLLRLDSQGHPDLRAVDPDTLEAFLDAAGIDKLGGPFDGKIEAYDPEILGRLTSSVSSALDQAEAALYGIKENAVIPGQHGEGLQVAGVAGAAASSADPVAARRGEDDKMIQETNEEGESLLSLACSGGYFELAHVLLKMNANVEDRGSKGDCTPLMEAASAGHVDIVKLLLEYGADANAQSSAGNTPLMYACNGGHEEIVKILLDQGANIEDHNENGHTPLMEAASSGHVNIAKILLEKGAGINTHSNEFKESALTLACYKGHLEMVKFLLEAGADHEHKTDEMHTALMEASMDGHVEVARLLLDHGAQVNMPADSFESPLTLAACGGHVKLASLLIERGANIEEVNDEGYTPLMEAAREGHEEMVALLLAQGANINAQTEETQETALTLACCGGFLEVARFLIEVGADIELGCSTPLMEAAQEGHVDLVKFLLSKGAIVHAQTATGDTALTYACENGHTDVADVLLAHGANLEHQTLALQEHESEGGRTPLMKAARAGHLCTVQYLISKGADVNRATTNNDHTVLSLACAGGHLKVVELLLAHNADPSHKLKDNSTCLIESAKGGHSEVMVLVLDYPTNMIAHPEGMATPPTPDQGEVSRVPTQALPILVPPQEPDEHPEEAHLVELNGSSLLGHGQQKTSLPTSSTTDESLYQRMASSTLTTTTTPTNTITTPAGAPSSLESMDATGIFNTSIPATFSPTNIVASTSLPDTAISKLDMAAIAATGVGNAKGHQRTAEEQILEKQQIYAELQKVERELQQRMDVQKVFSVGLQGQGGDEAASSKLTLPVSLPAGASVPSSTPSSVDSQVGISSVPVENSAAGVDPPASSMVASVPESNCNQSGNQKQSTIQVPPHLQPLPSSVSDGEESGDIEDDSALDTRDIRIVSTISSHQEDKGSGEGAANILGTDVRHEPLGCESQSPSSTSASVAPPAYESYNQSSNCNCVSTPGVIPAASSYSPALSSSLSGVTSTQLAGHGSLLPSSTSVPSPLPDVQTLLKESSGTQVDSSSLAAAGIGQAVLNGGAVQITAGSSANNITGMSGAMVMPHGYREVHRDPEKRPVESKKPPPQTQSVGTQCDRSSIPHHHQVVPAPLMLTTGGAAAAGVGATMGAGVATTTTATALVPSPAALPGSYDPAHFAPHPPVEIDAQTESNHDTALTIACAGGHDDLVQMLLEKNANIEHRDKKGFTPLILAATAGHYKTVQILLNHNADIEAQSERTKDTPLSLACSGGRYEVVELLLSHNANKEHRNVSDYTPLSLAASGGYVNIIKLLLRYGAEINSRTGSKLGISPLMLAAMNGHTAAVKLLLDMGSDINAQIETNRNTALTLACFQGRTEVVSLLVDRKANVEHRAKTGLTPLMEAASGGYADVGRVLISKGADVNAPPVPSSRDTALTIAADKGHYRFVELLLQHKAAVDVKNKKGQSSLWLACNGGHFDVVQLLVHAGADIDSQDNRKVSCLMAAFRKGHVKVVRWMVKHVNQFPSDTDCMRYIATISDREVLKKCQQCMEIIVVAKERQAAEANKHANILLEQLESEKTREESRKMAAAKRREKKKKKRKEKQQKVGPNNSSPEPEQDDDEEDNSLGRENSESYEIEDLVPLEPPSATTTTTIGKVRTKDTTTNTTARSNSQSNTTTSTTTTTTTTVNKKNKNNLSNIITATTSGGGGGSGNGSNSMVTAATTTATTHTTTVATSTTSSHRSTASSSNVINQANNKAALPSNIKSKSASSKEHANNKANQSRSNSSSSKEERQNNKNRANMNGDAKDGGKEGGRHEEKIREEKKKKRMSMKKEGQNHTIKHDDQNSSNLDGGGGGGKKSVGPGGDAGSPNMKGSSITAASPKRGQKREEGWKEVVRRSKKVTVPANAISRLIGRGGCNINAIRDATGAHIDVDRQNKGNERTINIKGSADATRQAHHLISALIKDPDEDLSKLVAKIKKTVSPAAMPITMFTATQAMSSSTSSTTTSLSQAGSKGSVQTGTTAAKQAPKMNHSSTASHHPPASKQNSLQPGHQQLTQSHSAPAANSQYPTQQMGGVRLPKGVQQHQMAALAQQWGGRSLPVRQPPPTTVASRVPDPSQHQGQQPQQATQPGRGQISVNVAPPVGSAPQQGSAKSPRSGVARQLFTQPAGKAITTTVSASRPIQSAAASGSGGVMASSAPSAVGTIPISASAQSNVGASGTFASKISESRSGLLHMPQMMMPTQGQVMGEQVGPGMHPQQPDGNRSAPVSTATGGFNFLSHMNQGINQNPGNAFGWSSLAPGGALKEQGTGEEGGFPNSEEAKAPGYKRLSTGSMPGVVGEAGLLSTVNNLQGNPANFNPIHFMHTQHQPPPHPIAPSNPHPHSQPHPHPLPHQQHPHPPPIERPDVSASMPHGHANLSHFSPITNPPAPSPTPPNANASPGTSPRSGTTSPSSSATTQDRKLPRPIGTERSRGQQTLRRTPVGFADLPFTSAGSIWAHQAGEVNWPNASISVDDMVVNTPAAPIQRPISRPESYHGQPMGVPVGMSYNREMSDQQPHPGGIPPTNHQPHPGSLPPPQAMTYTAPPSMGNGVWTPAISATDTMDSSQGWTMWNQPSM